MSMESRHLPNCQQKDWSQLSILPILRDWPGRTSALPIDFVVGGCCIADDFPAKKCAHLSKGVRIGVAKYDDVFRIKSHDKVLTITPKRHQSFRLIDGGVQFKPLHLNNAV
jgi:hypothetical protein